MLERDGFSISKMRWDPTEVEIRRRASVVLAVDDYPMPDNRRGERMRAAGHLGAHDSGRVANVAAR